MAVEDPVSADLLTGVQRQTRARFWSISVTPLRDDSRSLSADSKTVGLPSTSRLATGGADASASLERSSFYSDVAGIGADGLPIHLNRAFLLDRDHRVRGVCDASSVHDMLRLRHDIGLLWGQAMHGNRAVDQAHLLAEGFNASRRCWSG